MSDSNAENKPLTDKQEMFCHEYLVDLNATQAYLRVFECDYNAARTESSKLKANPNISARIRELMDARKDAVLVDAHFVVQNLIEISQRCQQAEPVKVFNYDTKQLEKTGEYVFDSNGANKALELIGKHLGMFKDKVEHSGEVKGFQIIIGDSTNTDNQPG